MIEKTLGGAMLTATAVIIMLTRAAVHSGEHLDFNQTFCLAEAVYWEAKSEPDVGKHAVAYVVLNRSKSRGKSICEVIDEPNQFPFVKRGKELGEEKSLWEKSIEISIKTQLGEIHNPIGSATYFHSVKVSPLWAKSMNLVTTLYGHKFYKDDRHGRKS